LHAGSSTTTKTFTKLHPPSPTSATRKHQNAHAFPLFLENMPVLEIISAHRYLKFQQALVEIVAYVFYHKSWKLEIMLAVALHQV
jgi:hypothetical protein